MFWTNAAYAMGASGAQGAEGAAGYASFLPLILMFAVFYFLLIRPQQKRAKEHRSMLEAIKRNDKVITSGGLHGRVVELNNDTLVIDLGDSKVTVSRSFISAVIPEVKLDNAKKEDKKSKSGNAKAEDKANSTKEVDSKEADSEEKK